MTENNIVISKKIELLSLSGNSVKNLKSGEGFQLKIENTPVIMLQDKEFSNNNKYNKQGDY